MDLKDAVVLRLIGICTEKNLNWNSLANLAGVTPSTVYSVADPSRRQISLRTVKTLCDGLDMTLGEFFSHPLFDDLEPEIK